MTDVHGRLGSPLGMAITASPMMRPDSSELSNCSSAMAGVPRATGSAGRPTLSHRDELTAGMSLTARSAGTGTST